MSEGLAMIPTKFQTEILCWEFKGKVDNSQWQEGRFVAECGVEVAPADVYVDDTGEVATFWHRYTERQKRLLREICRLLKQHYPIRYVVGHSDITDRKQDPGPELHGFMCK